MVERVAVNLEQRRSIVPFTAPHVQRGICLSVRGFGEHVGDCLLEGTEVAADLE